MRTTIELPDELLARARSRAALSGISLKEFFVEAVERKLAPPQLKTRKSPPAIGSAKARRIGILKPDQIDAAFFGGR